jgi:hypothetical protein
LRTITLRLSLFATLVAVVALPGQAEGACVERDWLVAELAAQHREKPVAQGQIADGAMLEILASPDGKTWTLLVTEPQGLTCTLVEGRDWHTLPPLVALNKSQN